MSKPKVEDYDGHVSHAKLTNHFLAPGSCQDPDDILRKVVYDHALQGRIILGNKDADLAICPLGEARIIGRCLAHATSSLPSNAPSNRHAPVSLQDFRFFADASLHRPCGASGDAIANRSRATR